MQVLHLSTTDVAGGAARAAYRLHQGLQSWGLSSQMLVQEKLTDDWTIYGPTSKVQMGLAKARATVDRLPLQFYRHRDPHGIFFAQWLPGLLPQQVRSLPSDLLNLHWVCGGFLQVEALAKLRRPIVWTLHDMWAFTGGCHYSLGCDRFTQTCGACPQLGSQREQDLSRHVWQRKRNAWKSLTLNLVTPSRWLAQQVQASSLLGKQAITVIPNGIDTQLYRPIDRRLARDWLRLPPDCPLILFGAMRAMTDTRKGLSLLQAALHQLRQLDPAPELVIFGAAQPQTPMDFGFKTHYQGQLHDEIALALLYAAVDLLVVPSTQDNLPNTVLEALACGTPCVGFKIGGMPDMIDHQHNGYLALPFDPADLAQGMHWVLSDRERQRQLSQNARQTAEQRFTQAIQAQRYEALYQKILAEAPL